MSSARCMPRSRHAAANVGDVVDGAEFGSTAVWPPADEPMPQGLPTSSALGGGRVVATLAVGRSDRVDRWDVHDVEPHRRRCSRADRSHRAACRAGLVDGGRVGPVTVERGKNSYHAPTAPAAGRRRSAAARAAGRSGHVSDMRQKIAAHVVVGDRRGVARRAARRRSAGERSAVGSVGAAGRRRQLRSPISRAHRRVRGSTSRPASSFLHGVAPPGLEVLHPTDDVVLQPAERVGVERGREPVVARAASSRTSLPIAGGRRVAQATTHRGRPTSWPSVNTSATMRSGSPSAAFAGEPPPSTTGRTASTTDSRRSGVGRRR